jgi:hypothetical protein
MDNTSSRYYLRSHSSKKQKFTDKEYKSVLRKNGFNESMTKYEIADKIKDQFLINQGFNIKYITQGFTFEGIKGELGELNSNYAVAIEVLGLVNNIPLIEKYKKKTGHLGYSKYGKPISLRDAFYWLDTHQHL